jgi:uncharacterized protein
VILCDAGPLIALIDRRQADHQKCADTLKAASFPLLTTWPCLAEGMYMLGARGGWPFQNALWEMLEDGLLQLHQPDERELQRSQVLMAQYRNVPMDLADATLVAAAERLHLRTVFTLDSDFLIYRTADGQALEIVPAEDRPRD